jgi:methylglyoxal synthase
MHAMAMAERTLALIAHDARKAALVELLRPYREVLAGLRLLATGTTGTRLGEELGLEVERVASGPEGGDVQIGARLVDGGVDALIFLRDPLTAHPHEPDIQALLKLCDTHDVPVATNRATARLLLDDLAAD